MDFLAFSVVLGARGPFLVAVAMVICGCWSLAVGCRCLHWDKAYTEVGIVSILEVGPDQKIPSGRVTRECSLELAGSGYCQDGSSAYVYVRTKYVHHLTISEWSVLSTSSN